MEPDKAKQLSDNQALLDLLEGYEDEENLYGDKPKPQKQKKVVSEEKK